MAWILLFVAGLLETGFATFLKLADGFTRPLPTVGFVVCAASSLYLLTLAMKSIPLGTAYAVWTGLGTAGAVAVGIFWFGDPVSAARLGFLALLLVAVVGLRVVSPV
jgi:quaternary ammonium compound-resistance protein SugE